MTAETPVDATDACDVPRRARDGVRQPAPVGDAQRDAHRRSAHDEGPGHPARPERRSGYLRYGTVSLNHWSAAGYGIGITPWGRLPGQSATRHRVRDGLRAQPPDVRRRREDRHPRTVPRAAQAALVREPRRSPQAHARAHPVRVPHHHPGRLPPIPSGTPSGADVAAGDAARRPTGTQRFSRSAPRTSPRTATPLVRSAGPQRTDPPRGAQPPSAHRTVALPEAPQPQAASPQPPALAPPRPGANATLRAPAPAPGTASAGVPPAPRAVS